MLCGKLKALNDNYSYQGWLYAQAIAWGHQQVGSTNEAPPLIPYKQNIVTIAMWCVLLGGAIIGNTGSTVWFM